MTPTKKRKEKVIFYWSIECLIYLSYDIKILIKAQKFNKKLFFKHYTLFKCSTFY